MIKRSSHGFGLDMILSSSLSVFYLLTKARDRKNKTRCIKIISNPIPWEILYILDYVHPLKMMQLCKIHLASARNASVQPYIFFFTFYKIQGLFRFYFTCNSLAQHLIGQKVKLVLDLYSQILDSDLGTWSTNNRLIEFHMSIHLGYGNRTWGVNIFVWDQTCRVSDGQIHPRGRDFLIPHGLTHDGLFLSNNLSKNM